MKRLVRYFFEGLLFVAPIAITVFVFYKIFALIDTPVRTLMDRVLGFSPPGVGFAPSNDATSRARGPILNSTETVVS